MKMRATRLVASGAAIGNMLNGWDSATLAGNLLFSTVVSTYHIFNPNSVST